MLDLLAHKKDENIAGYVISMWHLEDVLRASDLDPAKVEAVLIEPMDADAGTKDLVRQWYKDLIKRMNQEGIVRYGHLPEVEEVIQELQYMHEAMVGLLRDPAYSASYEKIEADVRHLQQQAMDEAVGEIETCFMAVYGMMVLRAKGAEISAATDAAVQRIREFLEELSLAYKRYRRLPGVSLN